MLNCNDGVEEVSLQSDLDDQSHVEDMTDEEHDSGTPEPSSPAVYNFNRWWFYGGVAAASILSVLGVCAIQRHNKRKRGQQRHSAGSDGSYIIKPLRDEPEVRIPLRDVIRFKERQWFVEELENARDGDPNAMLRLAKMYLNGQGCEQSASMAYEWLRKARALGVFASLDELYASDADTPTKRERIREMIAGEQLRRQARREAAQAQAQWPK